MRFSCFNPKLIENDFYTKYQNLPDHHIAKSWPKVWSRVQVWQIIFPLTGFSKTVFVKWLEFCTPYKIAKIFKHPFLQRHLSFSKENHSFLFGELIWSLINQPLTLNVLERSNHRRRIKYPKIVFDLKSTSDDSSKVTGHSACDLWVMWLTRGLAGAVVR